MGQMAIFEIRISQYLQTILSYCHGWRFRLGQSSCTHAFYRAFLIERKISFILVYNLPRFRPISMGQMAAQVVGLLLFLLLVFCAAVTAVRERSQGPKAEFYGPFIAFVYVQYQQVSKLLKLVQKN